MPGAQQLGEGLDLHTVRMTWPTSYSRVQARLWDPVQRASLPGCSPLCPQHRPFRRHHPLLQLEAEALCVCACVSMHGCVCVSLCVCMCLCVHACVFCVRLSVCMCTHASESPSTALSLTGACYPLSLTTGSFLPAF